MSGESYVTHTLNVPTSAVDVVLTHLVYGPFCPKPDNAGDGYFLTRLRVAAECMSDTFESESHSNREGRKLAMSARKKSSAGCWVIVHVFFPLLAFFLEGLIRFISCRFKLYWNTFGGSTLAMSLGLLFLFIDQSLLNQRFPSLMGKDPAWGEQIWMWSHLLRGLAIIFFALFAVIAILDSQIAFYDIRVAQEQIQLFDMVIFGSFPIVVLFSLLFRSAFKLKAVL